MEKQENIEHKNVEIIVPPNMDANTAQQCFLLGMKSFTACYNGGTSVTFSVKNEKEEGVKSLIFMNENAASMVKFAEAISVLDHLPFKEKILALQQRGEELINNKLEHELNDVK